MNSTSISKSVMESHAIGGSPFGFSAARIDDTLGATEYTLVGIAVDASGSIAGFVDDMETAIQEIVKACSHSDRKDYLMLRLFTFDNNEINEVHGYRPLQDCNLADYKGFLKARGMTNLYDATHNMVSSISKYGKDLQDQDYDANGILFVITDGCENSSTHGVHEVKEAFAKVTKEESLESLVSILVGVGTQSSSNSQELQNFKNSVGFTQFIETSGASERELAKLAQFVSKSISRQSSSLGTGGPSAQLSLTI